MYTKILEVNLFAYAYRLFQEDFSSIDGTLLMKMMKNDENENVYGYTHLLYT